MAERSWAVAPSIEPIQGALSRLCDLDDEKFDNALNQLYEFGGGKNPPGTFKDALIRYMEQADITVEELAHQSKVSERTIGAMRNREDYQPKLQTVIAICIGLRLNPAYSYRLIELAGYHLTNSKQDALYRLLLDRGQEASIEDCNKVLIRAKMVPL